MNLTVNRDLFRSNFKGFMYVLKIQNLTQGFHITLNFDDNFLE